MQNNCTLKQLGFKRHPEWDFRIVSNPSKKVTVTPHYRLEKNGVVFRAWTNTTNGTPYVSLQTIPDFPELYYGSMDCCSEGSVDRKINKILNRIKL